MNMITSIAWVPRGFAAPFPSRYQLDEDEYERISKLANLRLEDAKEDLREAEAEARNNRKVTLGKISKSNDQECAHQPLHMCQN